MLPQPNPTSAVNVAIFCILYIVLHKCPRSARFPGRSATSLAAPLEMGLIFSKEEEVAGDQHHQHRSSPHDEIISIMTPSLSNGSTIIGSGGGGGGQWKHLQQNHHVRQASVRSRASQPMPNASELDMRFSKVLVCELICL